MNLDKRICRYLEKHQDRWVSKAEIIKQATSKDYEYDYITDSIYALDRVVNIGKWSIGAGERKSDLPHGTYYRFYPMTEKEIEKIKEDKVWFDQL